jgi:hypothetical protein
MLSGDSRIFFPDPVEISQRGNDYVYRAPRRRVAVKVGPAGDRILRTCREADTVAAIVDRGSRLLELGDRDDDGVILSFLSRMIDLDFLSDNPAQPAARRPQAPSR